VNNVPDSVSSSDLEQIAQQRATRENIEQRVAQRNSEKFDYETLNSYGYEQVDLLVKHGVYTTYRDSVALTVRSLSNLATYYRDTYERDNTNTHALVAYSTVIHAIRMIDNSILD
jgi:hypothetical protein